MSSVEVALPAGRPLPRKVERFLDRAEEVRSAWFESTSSVHRPGFVASDPVAVWMALSAIADAHLAPGPVFCEWGSGLGVATALASYLGFDAYGIEVDPELVEAAEDLCADFAPEARFEVGSFLPEDTEIDGLLGEELDWLDTSAAPAYEDMGLDVDEIDLVYAYPWPGEEFAVYECFEQHAANGALLLTWHGLEGMKLRRKASERRRRPGRGRSRGR